MALKDVDPLKKFLKPMPPEVVERALWLRELIWKTFPEANELIYDNYNAVAVGWSPTEKVGHTFCSIAIGRTSHNVHSGFYWGSKIPDPKKLLIGEGNQYRYLLLEDINTFPTAYVKQLMKSACDYSMSLVKNEEDIRHGLTIVKSVSPVKRAKKAVKKAAKKVVRKKKK
jgi:hypothetical protein